MYRPIGCILPESQAHFHLPDMKLMGFMCPYIQGVTIIDTRIIIDWIFLLIISLHVKIKDGKMNGIFLFIMRMREEIHGLLTLKKENQRWFIFLALFLQSPITSNFEYEKN